MAKRISLFNHKGGVSKTTTTFNLGWKLAQKGHRVILVDCDPQCNLTGMVSGYKGATDLKDLYDAPGINNIRDALAPAFESRPSVIQPVECIEIEGNSNMFLLPGHIGLAEYEVTLGIAQELSGSIVTLQNLPGSLHYMFGKTAEKYDADYLLVDMSPSLGPLNQNLLMTSDFFIVPMTPDYFSVMATDSLASVLPRWHSWGQEASRKSYLRESAYPFPNTDPKFLGTVIQKYKIRSTQTPSKAFQEWITEVDEAVKSRLIPVLDECGMLLNASAYESIGLAAGDAVMQMSDFNGLIAQSQKFQAPVFDLTDDQLAQTGIVLERTKNSMGEFNRLYEEGADRVISLTND